MAAGTRRTKKVKRREEDFRHSGVMRKAKGGKFDTSLETESVARDIGNRKKFHPQDVKSFRALNERQEDFLHAYYQETPMILATGVAGSSKTFASLFCALTDVFDSATNYKKVKIVRSPVVAREVGFLPGPQKLDSKVLTPTGWVSMGDLREGDEVMAQDGSVTLVKEVHDFGEQDVYEVKTTTGKVTHSTGTHLWKTQNYNEYKHRKEGKVRTLKEISETLLYGNGRVNHYLPRPEPMKFHHKSKDLHPYVLGALLGDGSLGNSVTISSVDPEIPERVGKLLYPIGAGVLGRAGISYTLGAVDGRANKPKGKNYRGRYTNPLKLELDRLGLMGKDFASKFIPREYVYRASVGDRMELLRGLLDTDGGVHKGQAEFFTSNLQLAQDVVDLVRSLGGSAHIHSRMREEERVLGGRVTRATCPGHTLTIKLPECVGNPFNLKRKANLYKTRGSDGRKLGVTSDRVKSVEWSSFEPVRCIKVEHPDHLYITDEFIVTHNTMEEKQSAFEEPYKGTVEELMPRFKGAYDHLKTLGYLDFHLTSHLRGVTWNDTIVIFDEFQSSSFHEINTVITRLGEGSRIILTGDFRQNDLTKRGDLSGFGQTVEVLDRMPKGSYAHINYKPEDCVRSGLVRDWILATH